MRETTSPEEAKEARRRRGRAIILIEKLRNQPGTYFTLGQITWFTRLTDPSKPFNPIEEDLVKLQEMTDQASQDTEAFSKVASGRARCT